MPDAICNGSYALGTACGTCAKCIAERHPVPYPGQQWRSPGIVEVNGVPYPAHDVLVKFPATSEPPDAFPPRILQPMSVEIAPVPVPGGLMLALSIAAEDCAAALEADAEAANVGRERNPILAQRYGNHVEPAKRLREIMRKIRQRMAPDAGAPE